MKSIWKMIVIIYYIYHHGNHFHPYDHGNDLYSLEQVTFINKFKKHSNVLNAYLTKRSIFGAPLWGSNRIKYFLASAYTRAIVAAMTKNIIFMEGKKCANRIVENIFMVRRACRFRWIKFYKYADAACGVFSFEILVC